jgi:hypothetical protein
VTAAPDSAMLSSRRIKAAPTLDFLARMQVFVFVLALRPSLNRDTIS